jgi:hypothetical protein
MEILKKAIVKATILLCGTVLINGCSMKNITTSKNIQSTHISNSKTSISQQNSSLIIENEFDATESYQTQQCGYETRYLGAGTNYLMRMVGLNAYKTNQEKYKEGVGTTIGSWVLSPLWLPLNVAYEIITFQPFYDYSDIRICDDYESHEEAKSLSNEGTFKGSISVENSYREQNVKFNVDDEAMPLDISLQNNDDIFASSKKSIDTSNGLTVKISGFYKVNGRLISVDETKKIK